MKELTITVTEAARKFADCLNRAHYQNTTFILLKNGKPFARIEPENEKVCKGQELANALSKIERSPDNTNDWERDHKGARKTLKGPVDRWQ